MRSLLFVPADSERKLAKAEASGADTLLLDLEDAVSGSRKPAAREMAAEYIRARARARGRPHLYVRINALDTSYWQDDLAGVMAAAPDGIMLPKPRSGEDVHKLSIALNHAEERAGIAVGATRIIAIATEMPVSLLSMSTYIGASSRLEGLTWGAEDLSAELGSRATREDGGRLDLALSPGARSHALHGGRRRVQPIDTVFIDFRDAQGFREEARLAARDGFTGKMAIHPDQVAMINEVFTPSARGDRPRRGDLRLFVDNPDAGALP